MSSPTIKRAEVRAHKPLPAPPRIELPPLPRNEIILIFAKDGATTEVRSNPKLLKLDLLIAEDLRNEEFVGAVFLPKEDS